MRRPAILILITALTLLLLPAKEKGERSSSSRSAASVSSSMMNINRMIAWYSGNGKEEQDPFTGNAGVTYPRGTSTAIFSAGLIWGGYVSDGLMAANTPRVNGSSYNTGMTPGRIIGIRTGTTEDPADSTVRIYRIRRDFATADLLPEAKLLLPSFVDFISAEQLLPVIYAQYLKDWKEWPAAKGAPFYDADHDGKYTPKFDAQGKPLLYPIADEPGVADAAQVIWYVANDIRAGESPWKTKPIGLEMQVTLWAYDAPSNQGAANAIFKRHRFIYKGTAATPDTAKMTEFYLGQWSDPDLGDSGDDFAGCDSALGAGYVYNSASPDKEYAKYNSAPPAIGYVQLQGPTVPAPTFRHASYDFGWKQGAENLPATAFVPFSAGNFFSCQEPPFGFDQSQAFYQNLRGLPTYPLGPPDPAPFIDPVRKAPTRFVASGDPVLGTGWRDGALENNAFGCHVTSAGDRRFLLSTGPFSMKLGETQEVIYALVGAVGSDRLASITALKFFMKQNKQQFRYLFPDDPNALDSHFDDTPSAFLLAQNYPNPFNPSTRIDYEVPLRSAVSLKVYDAIGREVETLVQGMQDAGRYSVRWNGAAMRSGAYFYRLAVGTNVQTKKMLLVR